MEDRIKKNNMHLREDKILEQAKMGNWSNIENFIKKGFDVNFRNNEKYSLINYVTTNKQINMLKKYGANLDNQTSKGITVLMKAIYHENYEMIETLVNSKANLNIKNNEGYSALLHAAHKNNNKICELLIKNKADVNSFNKKNIAPLFVISNLGNMEILKLLINNKANINFKNQDGFTPVHTAVNNDKMEVVEELLKNGADPNITNYKSISPLHTALSLIKNINILKLLLEYGAHVDHYDQHGNTPLVYACYMGNLEMVKLLVNKGADIECSKGERTPMETAVYHNYDEIVEYFIEKGAKISHGLIKVAIKNNYLNIIKIFLRVNDERKIDINKNHNGYTLLHLAVSKGNYEIVNKLLENGADPLIKNEGNNKTALEISFPYKKLKICRLLLENVLPVEKHTELQYLLKSYDINSRYNKKNGDTLLHYYTANNDKIMVELLINCGANPKVKNYFGKNCFDLCQDLGTIKILKKWVPENIEWSFEKDLEFVISTIKKNELMEKNNKQFEIGRAHV